MSDLEKELAAIRAELDGVDERLVELINERAELARRIGQAKADAGLRVYAPDRERQVLDRIGELNRGPMPPAALRSVYRELMSASLALERSPRIALLGPAGSYAHLAGRRRFGASVEFETVATIAAVFDEVEHGHAEFGLAPVENSIIGGVGETLDALIDRNVTVCGEVNLAVHHHLLGEGPLASIQRVYSKPEVFAQCQTWLAETGLIAKTVPTASSSAAAQRAAEEPGAAALASERAAELFNRGKIAEHGEDDPGTVTRFLIIGTTMPKPTGRDKTSLVFGVGHESGRLAETLDVFKTAGLNMTRIESRADRRRRWAYYFFVDIEGHAETPDVARALRDAAGRCLFWKVVGSYS
ncbi:MAG: bifunctional chorismate mutase/prephenate dehydratase, partial [Phycisphaerae bacterium]